MTPYPLIDIGVNLMHKSFAGDRTQLLARAEAQGVHRLIITGTDLISSEAGASFAETRPGVLYSTAGFHPHHAKAFTREAEDALRRLWAEPQVVAVGECGLDFDRNFSPRPEQEACFEAHLGLAAETGKPLFLHERAAHRRFAEMLTAHKSTVCNKAVVHCFTGGTDELRSYLDLGCYIGITGWVCDERRGDALREALHYLPLDRLMLETDAPFLTPRTLPHYAKNSRNEPALLPYVLHGVADVLKRPAEEIAQITSRNAESFFGLA